MMNCMNVQEETYMVVFATSIRSTLPVYPCFLTWIFDKTLLLVFGPQYPHSLCFCWVVLTPCPLIHFPAKIMLLQYANN